MMANQSQQNPDYYNCPETKNQFKKEYQNTIQSPTYKNLIISFQILYQTKYTKYSYTMQQRPISKQEKQQFLRNQIVQGGLDPQCFMDFMGTIKNEGQAIQLDQWTMTELKKVVQDFKMQIKADTKTLQEVKVSQIRQSKQIMDKIIKSVIKKQKVKYDRDLWDYSIDSQQQCKSYPRAFAFVQKIKPKVQVISWQVKTSGGFFLGIGATKQLWLKIKTNFTSNIVQRSNTDIQWYRNTLLKTHPGSYVPPLSQLRAVQPQDKKGLTQRTKYIQLFLNSLLQYEYLIQCPLSNVFLSQVDHNKFTNYKSKEKNANYPKNVGRIQTLQGHFELEISENNKKFIKNCSLFGKVIHQNYTEVDSHINKVLSDMETLSKHVLYLSNSCGILNQKYEKICNLNLIKGSSMEAVMIYLNNLFTDIGNGLKQQINLVKQFADDFLHPNIRSWQEFLLHDKRYQRQLQGYLNFKFDLLKKKQKNFNDLSKWELTSEKEKQKVGRMNISVMQKDQIFAIMCPNDNKVQQQIRIWIAYINKSYQKSFVSLLKEEENRLKESFYQYIEKSTQLSVKNHSAAKTFQQMIPAK